MAEPFIAEIRMFAGTFAPRGNSFCDGQLLAISQNEALFSLLGTVYGGDGRTTFALPDMRGRLPLHVGTGPGLSPRALGSKGGVEKVAISVNQLPSHSHTFQASQDTADQNNPQNQVTGETAFDLYLEDPPSTALSASAITPVGGGNSHNNLQPFLCLNFIIALFGIFPSRN